MSLVWSNNANSTLASALAPSTTTITLATGTGALFPTLSAGQYFVGSLTDAATQTLHEIVWVTAISGDTLTVTRAQEGTTARSWSFGDIFSHQLTAGQMKAFLQSGLTYQETFSQSGASVTLNNQASFPPTFSTLQAGLSFAFPVVPNGLFRLHISYILYGIGTTSSPPNYGWFMPKVIDTTNGIDLIPAVPYVLTQTATGQGFLFEVYSGQAGNFTTFNANLIANGGVPSGGNSITTKTYPAGSTISVTQKAALVNSGTSPLVSAGVYGTLILTAIAA